MVDDIDNCVESVVGILDSVCETLFKMNNQVTIVIFIIK